MIPKIINSVLNAEIKIYLSPNFYLYTFIAGKSNKKNPFSLCILPNKLKCNGFEHTDLFT